MADAASRGKVQGIITLSTPFMTAVQRNVYSLVRGILSLLFPIVAVIFYPFFAHLHAAHSGKPPGQASPSSAFSLGARPPTRSCWSSYLGSTSPSASRGGSQPSSMS
jgi:hypothetical protein